MATFRVHRNLITTPEGCPWTPATNHGRAQCKCDGHRELRRRASAIGGGARKADYAPERPDDLVVEVLVAGIEPTGRIFRVDRREAVRRLLRGLEYRNGWLTRQEIAQRVGVHVRTVERIAKDEREKAERTGTKPRVRASE